MLIFSHSQASDPGPEGPLVSLKPTSGLQISSLRCTVKPLKNGHSQKDQKLVFKTNYRLLHVGLARLIKISVNRSIYKRKTIINMKIKKSVTFNDCSVYLFH